MNAAALLLPFVVALPHGATAPPPGALPATARVTTLDRELGLALVRMPKRGLAPALRRLRAAPGVRYVERDAPVAARRRGLRRPRTGRRKARSRLAQERSTSASARPRESSSAWPTRASTTIAWRPCSHRSCISRPAVSVSPHDPDRARHGGRQHPGREPPRRRRRRPRAGRDAAVGANRQVRSVQRDHASSTASWRRSAGCAGMARRSSTSRRRPSHRLRSSNRCGHCSSRVRWSWPQSATTGTEPSPRFPASQPGVLGVGELAAGLLDPGLRRSRRAARSSISSRRRRGSGSSRRARAVEDLRDARSPPDGTSFATPIVTAAAAMVWASHRDWTAAEVASALTQHAPRRSRSWCRTSTPATASST